MHDFILRCFSFFRSLMQFLKIMTVFIILILLCYWVQNLTGATWAWLGFIAPFFDGLLDFSDKIYSLSFDFFGAVFELKYFTSVIILVIFCVVFNILSSLSVVAEDVYKSAHFVCKKTTEAIFNKGLETSVAIKEKKISKYSLTLKAKLKKKFAVQGLKVDIEGQNQQINDFIINTLELRPFDVNITNNGMFYFSEYKFDDFDNIDSVLSVMFKVLESKAQLDYAICIQVGESPEQLAKLLSLNNFGKITMTADTAFRYSYVKNQKYKTTIVGEFKNNDTTFEVHEFQKKFFI